MKRLRLRLESGVVPGRFDLTVSVCRHWRPGAVGLSRHFTVYVAFLPIVREYYGARGYRWRRSWVFGRHGGGRGNFHLGPVGFWWT